jgi:hypothetical protein
MSMSKNLKIFFIIFFGILLLIGTYIVFIKKNLLIINSHRYVVRLNNDVVSLTEGSPNIHLRVPLFSSSTLMIGDDFLYEVSWSLFKKTIESKATPDIELLEFEAEEMGQTIIGPYENSGKIKYLGGRNPFAIFNFDYKNQKTKFISSTDLFGFNDLRWDIDGKTAILNSAQDDVSLYNNSNSFSKIYRTDSRNTLQTDFLQADYLDKEKIIGYKKDKQIYILNSQTMDYEKTKLTTNNENISSAGGTVVLWNNFGFRIIEFKNNSIKKIRKKKSITNIEELHISPGGDKFAITISTKEGGLETHLVDIKKKKTTKIGLALSSISFLDNETIIGQSDDDRIWTYQLQEKFGFVFDTFPNKIYQSFVHENLFIIANGTLYKYELKDFK